MSLNVVFAYISASRVIDEYLVAHQLPWDVSLHVLIKWVSEEKTWQRFFYIKFHILS